MESYSASRSIKEVLSEEIPRAERGSLRHEQLRTVFKTAAAWWRLRLLNENIAFDEFLFHVRDANAFSEAEIQLAFCEFVRTRIERYGEQSTLCDLTTYSSYVAIKAYMDERGEGWMFEAFRDYVGTFCLTPVTDDHRGF